MIYGSITPEWQIIEGENENGRVRMHLCPSCLANHPGPHRYYCPHLKKTTEPEAGKAAGARE